MQSLYPFVNNLSKVCSPVRPTVCIRCIQTAIRRRVEEKENGDGSSQDASKSSTAASNLLNVLADIKVQKVTKGDDSPKPLARSRTKLSAAANFQRMVTRAVGRTEKESVEREDQEEKQSPGLHKVQEMVTEAAKKVAEAYPDGERTESDLLQQLRKHNEATAAGEKGDQERIKSILSGIRVQKQTSIEQQMERPDSMPQGQRSLANQFGPAFSAGASAAVADFGEEADEGAPDKAQPYKRQRKRTLFDRHRLNIFNPGEESIATPHEVSTADSTGMTIWDQELQKQLTALSYATIHNGFEEAMKLTEEGKLWKYPIDNEQGLEEEQQVGFDEHIFLDHLLEDFPQRPAVLDFMELVLIGLSKNPYLTVTQKRDHIDWFRNYFQEKEDILQRVEEAEQEKASAS